MTMDDPGWGGYVPPSEPAPSAPPAGNPGAPAGGGGAHDEAGSGRATGTAWPSGATQDAGAARPGQPAASPRAGSGAGLGSVGNLLNQQQLDKAKSWLSVPKNKKIALGGVGVLIIVIIVAAVGFGGGGGLSKSQYIARADAICTNSSPLLQSAESAGNETELVSVAQTELSQLKALGSPNQGAQTVNSWLTDETAAVAAIQQGNVSEYETKASQGAEIAASYGLKSCAG